MRLRFARASILALIAAVALVFAGCKPANVTEAEAKHDVDWLASNDSPEAVAALGRLADGDAKALQVLEKRASTDVNTYIAAWSAVTRIAAWGATFIRTALNDPTRAEMAASALPRRDPRLLPFANDRESAVVRLAAE